MFCPRFLVCKRKETTTEKIIFAMKEEECWLFICLLRFLVARFLYSCLLFGLWIDWLLIGCLFAWFCLVVSLCS